MKLSYRARLFLNSLLLFALFTGAITLFQVRHERALRRKALGERLADYARVANSYLTLEGEAYERLMQLLPDSMRLTVLNARGDVLFDNWGGDSLENHLSRTEIQQAILSGHGDAIRHSTTLNADHYYYAEAFPDRFIRLALPYTKRTQSLLSVDSFFLYIILALFVLSLLALLYLSGRMGRSIKNLREFTRRVANGEKYQAIQMPDNELGEVGKDIIHAYQMLEASNERIRMEQGKLLQHFMHTAEGIALFDEKGEIIYYNTHFLRYINILRDDPTIDLTQLLTFPEFDRILGFIRSTQIPSNHHSVPTLEFPLTKGRLHFSARVLLFPDRSFEITLSDDTQQEENKKLRQEMTSNIAHELRTPVSSIQGYVETLLRNENLDPEQRQRFLSKAFSQCERLSALIRDITLIATYDERIESKNITLVNLHDLFNETTQELSTQIAATGAEVENALPPSLTVEGNRMQLYALWRNLLENALRYAGAHAKIYVGQSARDAQFCYLNFWDNGVGVEERHLERLFERFYRVDTGRTRQAGGSGLGLAIVKNTVLAHGGQIAAKRHQPQGLEFVFTLQLRKE